MAMTVNSLVVSIAPECNGNVIVTSMADLNGIQQCPTINGSLAIDSTFNNDLVELGNIETITGDFVIDQNHQISEIRGLKVATVKGQFRLHQLTNLFNMELPSLQSADSIEWRVLPILLYANTLPIKVNRSVIVSDTSLQELNLENVAREIDVLDINNNHYLHNLLIPIEKVGTLMHLVSNGDGMTVDLANLTHVKNMTVQHLGRLHIHQLEAVEDLMAVISNRFEELNLLKLRRIGGTMFIATNSELTSIKANGLEEIRGGIVFINNTKLQDIDGFKQLSSIGGALHVEGPVDLLEFENLRELRGLAWIKATLEFDCDVWLSSDVVSKIRGGTIRCELIKGQYTSHDDEDSRHVTQEAGPATSIATKPTQAKSGACQVVQLPWLLELVVAFIIFVY